MLPIPALSSRSNPNPAFSLANGRSLDQSRNRPRPNPNPVGICGSRIHACYCELITRQLPVLTVDLKNVNLCPLPLGLEHGGAFSPWPGTWTNGSRRGVAGCVGFPSSINSVLNSLSTLPGARVCRRNAVIEPRRNGPLGSPRRYAESRGRAISNSTVVRRLRAAALPSFCSSAMVTHGRG